MVFLSYNGFIMNKKTLPGTAVPYRGVSSSGYSMNSYGVGDMDISLYTPDQKYKWKDIARVNFASPTERQLLDAQTSPEFTDGSKAFDNINRRLSFKQAQIINSMFILTLEKAFRGEIPADDEIGDFFDQWKKEQNY